jgi:hypothetical protein
MDQMFARRLREDALLGRNNRNPAAVRAVVFELHLSGNLREERVVLPKPDVEARLEPTTALPYQDGSAGYEIAVMTLHAETLRVRIAAVA